MFTCSPQEERIVEFRKMTPFKSLHILNTGLFCLVIVVHESLVCPERLNFLLVLGKRAGA